MTNNEQIRITLLANAGIIINYNKMKFLIDGIQRNDDGLFPGLSENVLNDLLEGEKTRYKNIDYLLFTHSHPDHFTSRCVEDFLGKHYVKGLFLPDQPTRQFKSLHRLASAKAEQTWLLNLPLNQRKEIQIREDISVTVFRSIHAGKQFADVIHFCYLLNFNGKKILILADSNYDLDYFSRMLAEDTIETAFVNPLYINQSRGREIITQALQPKRIVVYHVPFEDKNNFRFRKMALRDIKKYRDSLPPVDILLNELQEIYV